MKHATRLLCCLLLLCLCLPALAQSGGGSVQVPVSLDASVGPIELQNNWWVSGDISSAASSVTPSLDHIYSYYYILEVAVAWTYNTTYGGTYTAYNQHDSQGWTVIRTEEGPHIWPADSPANEQWTHLCSFNAGTLFAASHPDTPTVSYTLVGLTFRHRLTTHLTYFNAGVRTSVGSAVWTEPVISTHSVGNP